MDEKSWRARLARSNINILSVDRGYWVIEFTYHPKPGTFKWCKTVHEVKPVPRWPEDKAFADLSTEEIVSVPLDNPTYEEIANDILDEVLELRKELEN